MAIQTGVFITGFEQLLADMRERDEVADGEYAQRLGELIEALILSVTIVYTTGLSSPSGVVTGTFNGNLQ